MNAKNAVKDLYLSVRRFFLVLCLRPARKEKALPESIVAVRIDRIGDLVVSIPALQALRAVFPNARLAVVAQEHALALLGGLEWIDEKIPYRGFRETVRVLRKKNFSLAIDMLMDYTLKTSLLVRFSRARVTAGFDIAGRGSCFSVGVIPGAERKAMSLHMLDLASAIAGYYNIDTAGMPRNKPCLTVRPEIREAALEFLRKEGVAEGALIVGIHPGANFPSQRWQPERFAQLADSVISTYRASVVIIGSGQERSIVNDVAQLMRNRPLLAVGFPLDRLAGVIARMSVLVCNNSGPLHVAAALGIPTVSTMGPTDPDLWWPQGGDAIVIRRQLHCSPCSRAYCAGHECMGAIGVEEMEQAVGLQIRSIKENNPQI
ncbi:MAG: glycosyltransferase family 9 protein [Candidatus Omnitrophota bacterium]